MGALPNVQPRNSFIRDRLRGRTDFKTGDGWAKLYHAVVADLPYLSRGASCSHLVLAVNAMMDRKAGDGWTPALSLEDWAELSGCDEKEVQRNRDYLKKRKMAEVRVDTKRLYAFRLLPERWAGMEDYKTWLAKQAPEDPTDEPDPEDSAQNDVHKAGSWRMSKPAKVKPGGRSRAYKPDVGIAEFQLVNDSKVAFECFCKVESGKLVITPRFKVESGHAKNENVASKVFTKVPEDMHVLGNGKKPGRKKGEQIPRAAELVAIFDPLLQKSGARLLSPDSSSLHLASEAIADTPKDFLLKFLMGPNGRASRPIGSPRYVVGICLECSKNYRKSNKGNSLGRIDALCKVLGQKAFSRDPNGPRRAELLEICRRIVDAENFDSDPLWADAKELGQLLRGLRL